MKLRVVVSLIVFASLFAGAAQAQDERKTVDVFAGYSYVRANPSTSGADSFSLNGGSASVAYNFNHWLSGVADFGGYHNTNILGSGVDGTLSTYLFGPRVSYHHFHRVTPFGEVLFGVAHTGANLLGTPNNQNAFAMTVGGGVDYRLSSHFALRPVKVDYLLTRFDEFTNSNPVNQNNLRVSTGIVFRF
ncbi:MAG TPA: outer membrane beta-barrel protein [Candidatus Acidoferrum sp.]|nr:outer membrane beta-barrel protein [Candidatus Acidoferrum sp.]